MNRRDLFPAAVIVAVLLVTAAYLDHFNNGFHFDDSHTVVENPYIRSLSFIPRFFTDSRTFSTLPLNQGYRPLVSTSLALDYWMGGGLTPLWFHISTFLALLVLLGALYALFRRVLDQSPTPHPANRWAALWGATLFCVHPAGAETVNYVIQRADLYVALGWVASMALFARGGRIRRNGLYLVPFLLAGLSKPTALVFPLLLALYLAIFEQPRPLDLGKQLVPSLLATTAMVGLHARMTPPTYTTGATDALGYRLTQPWVALHFVHMFVWPSQLSADSDWAPLPASDPRVWVGLFFLALLVIVTLAACRRPAARAAGFGLGWFSIAMLPTSLTPLAEVTNDHRMFAPFVGLALVAAWAGLRLWRTRDEASATTKRTALAVLGVVILLTAVAGTFVRNQAWLSEDTLWADTVQKSPRNGRAWMNYGLGFMAKGSYPKALQCFEEALRYTPRYPYLFINLGVVHGAMGNASEAERWFRDAMPLDPSTASACFFYARWLDQQKRSDEAVTTLEEGLRRAPQSPEAETLLMQILHRQGNVGRLDQMVSSMAPDDPLLPLARTHATQAAAERRERLEKARATAREKPSADAFLTLSLEAYRAGCYDECVAAARDCLKADPRRAAAWNNICAASNQLGRWDDAIAAANAALAIDPTLQIARNNRAHAEKMKAAGARAPVP